MLFGSIERMIQICQLLGLAPFSFNENISKWEQNTALKFASIIVIVIDGIILLIALTFNNTFIAHEQPMPFIVLINLFLVLSHIHALSAILEKSLNSEKQVNLLNIFDELDFQFKRDLNMNIDGAKLNKDCRGFIFVWACEIITFIIMSTIFYFESHELRAILYLIILLPPLLLGKLSYAYTIMLVTMLHYNINVLNKYIKTINKQNGYYFCAAQLNQNEKLKLGKNGIGKSRMNLDPKKLIFIARSYSKIWDISIIIQHTMNWSLPIGFTNGVFILIFNSYWFFLSLMSSFEWTTFIFQLTQITHNLGNVIFIVHNFSKAAEAVSKVEVLKKF